MDGADLSPTPADASAAHHGSRPTLGFPLGTALLLVVIFSLSGIFSCCYHWEKLRSLCIGRSRRQQPQESSSPSSSSLETLEDGPHPHQPSLPSKLAAEHQEKKQTTIQSLPVIMPGDKFPKFMAWPCPCPRQCQQPPSLLLPENGKIIISMMPSSSI